MCMQTGEGVVVKLELLGILPEQGGQIYSQSLKVFGFFPAKWYYLRHAIYTTIQKQQQKPHTTLPRGAQFLSKELTKPRTSSHKGSVVCLTGLGKRDLPNCSLRTATNNPATLSLKSEQPRAKTLDCLCRKQSSVSLHQPHETSFYQNSLKHAIMCSF